MSEYTVFGHKMFDVPDSVREALTASHPNLNFSFKEGMMIRFSAVIEAPCLRGDLGAHTVAYNALIGFSPLPSMGCIFMSKTIGWYSPDVLRAVQTNLSDNRHGGPFTEAEQADPDSILLAVPEGSTPAVILAARRRRMRLRKLLLVRAFCLANPTLSFQEPGNYRWSERGGVTKLHLKRAPITITFRPKTNKVCVACPLLPGEKVIIDANDSHRLQAVIDFYENYHANTHPPNHVLMNGALLPPPPPETDAGIPF